MASIPYTTNPPSIGSDGNLTFSPTTREVCRRELFCKAFDNRENKPVKHDQCFVLLLSWDENIDDLKVKPEVEKLKATFENMYGFNVTWKTLGNQAGDRVPKHQLSRYLGKFMEKYDKKNTLLIIYYAGHGVYVNDSVHFQPKNSLQTKAEQIRDRVPWSSAENCIRPVVADVLVILDCCEAGGYGDFQVATRSSRPKFDIIAACGVTERTRLPGITSFTSALMWALEELLPEPPFTSISLVEKVKKYQHLPKTQTPQLRRKYEFPDGLVWMAPLPTGPEPEAVAKSEHRNPMHEYIDLRFNFYRRVEPEDAANMAKHLSELIKKEDTFAAKHITLRKVSSPLSNAVEVWKSSSMSSKRKSSSSTFSCTRKHVPDHHESVSPPFAKGQRRESVRTVHTRELNENQGALYHFRMFFHCSLQNLGSGIGRMADRAHPPILHPEVATDSLNDRTR